MTLERHRSHLIPDVQYSLDGTIFITDTGGTFPLRGKGKEHKDIRGHKFEIPEPAPSYRSYDPYREKKRMYKQRGSPNRFGQEVATITGTSTISTSSLGRKLRRSKRKYSSVRGKDSRFDRDIGRRSLQYSQKHNGHNSGGSTGQRLRSGPPKIPPDFMDTLQRKRSSRQEELDDIIRGSGRRKSRESDYYDGDHRYSNGSIHYDKKRLRKIHDEKLPYMVFLIAGALLFIIGVIRMVISYWHEYYCPLWSGLLALFLGIIGAKHKGMYLAKGINAAYIFFAFIVSIAMMASSAFVLMVFIPSITLLSNGAQTSEVIKSVSFTNMGKTLTSLPLQTSVVTWASIALDLSTLIFIFVSLFSLAAAMVAISNHWDAAYDTTADCDHRGNPRLFNPIEQVSLGQATVFVGLVYIAAEQGFTNISHDIYFSPVWAGGLVIVSGILSFCFGKRTDMLAMGTFACFVELLAFAACAGSIVLVTLSLVEDVEKINDLPGSGSAEYNDLLVMCLFSGALVIVLTVDVIFVVGIIFRQFRQVCCRDCCREKEVENYHASGEGHSRFQSITKSRY